MANVKLTNQMRSEILSNATKGAFDAESKALMKAHQELSLRAYDALVPKAVQKALSVLPKDFCYTNDIARVLIAQNERTDARVNLMFGKALPLPYSIQYDSDPRIVDAELYRDWIDYKAAEKRQEAESDALIEKIRYALLSVSTVAKLLEIWPEAKAYLPRSAFAMGGSLLPAVIVTGLNEAIAKATGKPTPLAL